MTREPAEPLVERRSSPARWVADEPPPAWEVDDDATPAAQAWEAADGVTWEEATSSASAPSARAKPKPSAEDDEDLPSALPIRQEPWRLIHLMIGVAVVAVVMWVWVTLRQADDHPDADRDASCWPSRRGSSWRGCARPVRRRCSRSWRSPPSATCRWPRPSRPSPTSSAGGPSAGCCTSSRCSIPARRSPRPSRTRAGPSRDAILMAWVGQETGLLAPALRLVAGESPGAGHRLVGSRLAAGLPARDHADRREYLGIPPLLRHAQVRGDLPGFQRPLAAGHGLPDPVFPPGRPVCADRDADHAGPVRDAPVPAVLASPAG